MAAGGCGWTLSLLRSAHEPTGADDFSVPSRLVLASLAVAAEPERPRPLGSHAASDHSLAAFAFCLSSLSSAAHGRYHLRQEPDAGNPPVRIRGGGHEQSRSLLRLFLSFLFTRISFCKPTSFVRRKARYNGSGCSFG